MRPESPETMKLFASICRKCGRESVSTQLASVITPSRRKDCTSTVATG